MEAVQTIADMENELEMRRSTVTHLETRILQLRQSVEMSNRRLIDLKQGAIAARAAKREDAIQKGLGANVTRETAFDEAEALIQRVLTRDDPFEHTQILKEIDSSLNQTDMADRLAEAGFGPSSKSTASDVLARMKTAN